MIRHLYCDVLDTYASIVAHQVNCMGVMGSGVASKVKQRYPYAYKMYKELCAVNSDNPSRMLGIAQLVPVSLMPDGMTPRICIANLFGQCNYGRDKRKQYTEYAALERCLVGLASFASKGDHIVAIPYKMGCDRGGGDWDGVVFPMIERTMKDIDVLICKYDGLGDRRKSLL